VRIETVARDDPGDMRAVAVVVVRKRGAIHEILEVRNPLIAVRIELPRTRPCREIIVEGGDTRVDDRNADTGASQPQEVLREKGAARDRCAEVVSEDRPIVADSLDVRICGNRVQKRVRNVEDVTVEGSEPRSARIPSELGRQLPTAADSYDDARGLRRRCGSDTPREFGIELRS
jgi:hypothetical protein